MIVVFLGNASWSVPTLEALAGSSHTVARVLTRSPRPQGRGAKVTSTPVARAAATLGLPLVQIDSVRGGDGFEALAEAHPEVLVVVAYGEILPPAVLHLPSRMPVNLHFSLLPELRGAAPVQRAILEGLEATGVTTIRMDEGMDTGPILLQAEEGIDPVDDAGTLGARLSAMGARLVVDTLDRLQAGALAERLQDEARASFAPRLTSEEEIIDWRVPAEVVARQVRALAPTPGARTMARGRVLKVLKVVTASVHADGGASPPPPGTLMPGVDGGMLVATGGGRVALETVLPAGRRPMSGAEFARGFRPGPGERLH